MYYNDKNQRVTVRLSEEEWNFILFLCDETGKRPSDMIRYCIDNVALSYSIARENVLGGGFDGSDRKTDINYQL